LELRVAGLAPSADTKILVTSATSDDAGPLLAASSLLDLGYRDVSVLAGGLANWRRAGHPVETGLTGVRQARDDVLPARRSYADMLNYLRWEEELGEKYRLRR